MAATNGDGEQSPKGSAECGVRSAEWGIAAKERPPSAVLLRRTGTERKEGYQSQIANRKSQILRGFTLVEMLTVISIIAVVAGLIIGLAPSAAKTMRKKRVESDLQQLVMAIEQYKSKFGHYPPDNVTSQTPLLVNAERNPLYYELTGAQYDNNVYVGPHGQAGVTPNIVNLAFNRPGFVNSTMPGDDAKEGKMVNFLPHLKNNQIAPLPGFNPPVYVLVAPVEGTNKTNVWRYVSTSPTNNPSSFDLWTEMKVGKEVKIIGNWNQ